VRPFFTNVRAGLAGIALGCAAIALLAVLSGFALSDARLAEVVRTAFAENELGDATRIREDFFTECALLEMQKLRQGSVLWSALDTRFIMPVGEAPCDTLRSLVLGTPEQRAALPASASYFNYPFGSRHLEAFVLSAIDYGPATALYRGLSYGSVVVLFGAMLWRLPATALPLAPVPLFLIGAFAFHRFGSNLAHAPGFFVGFAALAIFVAASRLFDTTAMRIGFAGALGVLAAYFDMLNGVIVTLVALTILLNHFFYAAAERGRPGYLFGAASQALAIFACFLAAYLVVTLGRLGLLWLNGVDVMRFAANLAVRTGQDIGVPLSFRQNLETLFAIRSQLTPGGARTANWVFLAGVAGWIFAGVTGLVVFACRRSLRIPALVDVLVLATVSLGVLAWYRCFTAHTFVHAAFMVRLLAIPLACGLTAALLVAREERDRLPALIVPGTACLALGLAALGLHGRWLVGTATAARFIEAPADLVSCGPLGLKPDGKPDGVLEIRFQDITPPLAYLGLRIGKKDTAFQLARRGPDAAYHTGAFHNVVGIATEPGGPLRNRPDGGFRFAAASLPRVFAHVCREGEQLPRDTS
jgi:hypothetical protein